MDTHYGYKHHGYMHWKNLQYICSQKGEGGRPFGFSPKIHGRLILVQLCDWVRGLQPLSPAKASFHWSPHLPHVTWRINHTIDTFQFCIWHDSWHDFENTELNLKCVRKFKLEFYMASSLSFSLGSFLALSFQRVLCEILPSAYLQSHY